MFFDITLPAMRRRAGKTFRKRLGVYSYKLENPGYYKKPGVIPLQVKEKLKNVAKPLCLQTNTLQFAIAMYRKEPEEQSH